MTVPKRPPHPPHPFGKTRKERVEQWRARAVFGDPDDPMTEIARRVMLAAEASNDADMHRLALQALGLDGDKATDGNVHALRDALDELGCIVGEVYPTPDPFDGSLPFDPAEARPEARARLAAVLHEGVPAWLYRRARGTAAGSTDTALKFLKRVAARDPDGSPMLEWALSISKAHRTAPKHSRGRVR